MLAKVYSAAVWGVDAYAAKVKVLDFSGGKRLRLLKVLVRYQAKVLGQAFGLNGLVLAVWFSLSLPAHGAYSDSVLPFEKTPPASSGDLHSSADELIAGLEAQSVQHPGDAEVWYQLGLAYAQTNRTDRAIFALQKAVALNPGQLLTWENLGSNLYDAHRPQDALAAFQKAIDLGTQDPEVWNSYAMMLLDVGRLPESEKALNRGFQLDPHSRRLWNSLGLLRFRQGRTDEALKAYRQGLQIDPTYAIAWNNLGVAQSDSGAPSDAMASYQNAVHFDPGLGQAWENMALAYLNQGDFVDAGIPAEQAIHLLPNDPDGWIFMAMCARARSNFEQVVEYYHQAIDVLGLQASFLKDKHDRALAYAEYGNGCTNIGHFADAEKLMGEAFKIDPTSPDAWDDLAFLQMSQGKTQEALATIERGLALDPNQAGGWVTLGSIYLYNLNQPKKAEPAYQKAVEIQPGYSGAWFGLGRAEQELLKREEAAQAFRHAVQATPDYLDAWQRLGATSSDPAEADRAFAKAISLDPRNATTYAMQGALLSQRGDWAQAETALRQATALAGDNSLDWNLLSAALFKQQRFAEAADAEEKAIQHGTSLSAEELAKDWSCLAEAHIYQAPKAGAPEWEAALNAATHATALNPKMSAYWYERAMCDQALGHASDAATARAQWKATGSRIPRLPGINSPPSPSALAAGSPNAAPPSPVSLEEDHAIKALIQNRQFGNAYDEAQTQTAKRPNDPVAWYDLGHVLMNMRRYDEAVTCLTKATSLEPKMGPAWFDLGNSLAYLQRFDDAIDSLTKAIDFMPDFPLNWEALAECYSSRGNLADGSEKLKKLLEAHPDNGYGWSALGSIELTQGEVDPALNDLQKAVNLQPGYSMAWNSLGLAYKDKGQLDEAIASMQRATITDPANVEAWNNLGFFYFTAGKSDKAIDSYQRALKINPQHLLALYNIAAAYEQQKRWDLARQACDALAQVNPAQAEQLREQIPATASPPAPSVHSSTAPSTPQTGYLQIGSLTIPSQNSSRLRSAQSQMDLNASNFSELTNLGRVGTDFRWLNIAVYSGLILGIIGLIAITYALNPRPHKKRHPQPIARPPPMKPRR